MRNNDLLITISTSYTRNYISTLYIHQISTIPALHTFQHSILQETTKLIHEFILYTRNFLHENGKQILHTGEYQ